jgi:hypothetical protein
MPGISAEVLKNHPVPASYETKAPTPGEVMNPPDILLNGFDI